MTREKTSALRGLWERGPSSGAGNYDGRRTDATTLPTGVVPPAFFTTTLPETAEARRPGLRPMLGLPSQEETEEHEAVRLL